MTHDEKMVYLTRIERIHGAQNRAWAQMLMIFCEEEERLRASGLTLRDALERAVCGEPA